MIRKTIQLFLLLFLAIGCQVKMNNNQTFINDNISSNIKSDIMLHDNRIIEAIKTNQPNVINDIFSGKLIEQSGDDLDTIFNVTYEILKDAEFKKLDYLYVINATDNVSNTIFSGMTGDDDYIIHYKALNKNVFISLYTAETPNNEMLIALIYGETKNGWKLHHLQFGTYSLYHKTSIDFYKEALRYDSLGYLVDAANHLFLAQKCLKPANQLWQWLREKDIVELQKSVMEKINTDYKFPLTIEEIETKPQIYNIYPQLLSDSYETMIVYYSQINLKDTVALKKENLEIQKLIGKIFSGIDTEKNYLLYRATNELPNGTPKKIERYGFIQELDNE